MMDVCIGIFAAVLTFGGILAAVVIRQINQAAQDEAAMNGEPK